MVNQKERISAYISFVTFINKKSKLSTENC